MSTSTETIEQLATRALDRRLTRLQATGRDFVEEPVCGVAELPKQDDPGAWLVRVVQERNDRRGARVPDQFQLTDAAVGKPNAVYVEVQDLAFVQAPRGNG